MDEWTDGGPAFPLDTDSDKPGRTFVGMSLRDWFAGQALPMAVERASDPTDAELTFLFGKDRTNINRVDIAAAFAYAFADAMLISRAKWYKEQG